MPKILKHFSNSKDGDSLRIKITNLKNNKEEPEVSFIYDKDKKRFWNAWGSVAPPNDQTSVPIFEFNTPYKNNYSQETSIKVDSGTQDVVFNILFDTTMKVEYDVELELSGNKVTWDKGKHQVLEIHMPKYKVTEENYGGAIYQYCKNNKLANSNYEEVQYREPQLIYTVKNTIKDYSLDSIR